MANYSEYLPDLGIVEVKLIGQVTVPELRKVTTEARELSKVNDTILFLVNSSELEDIPILDIYFLPKLYDELGFDRRSKIAQIMPEHTDPVQNADFYEDVLVNRGWNIKSFTNREQAIFWLTNEQ
jgi:hypothetical protein